MAGKYKAIWSERSITDTDLICNFLLEIWTQKEVVMFLDHLREFEKLVCQYPEAYPISQKIKDCRLGLIHKNITAVYKVKNGSVFIVTLFDNRTKSKYR
jgi:hypothetical protein